MNLEQIIKGAIVLITFTALVLLPVTLLCGVWGILEGKMFARLLVTDVIILLCGLFIVNICDNPWDDSTVDSIEDDHSRFKKKLEEALEKSRKEKI